MNELASLQEILANAGPELSAFELAPGYPAIRVEHSAATALLALHGAHLVAWHPTGAQPVLYTSPDAVYREGKAIRGGIPVCWPWFNAHPNDPSKPSHGIARNRFWTLASAEVDEEFVTLSFTLKDDEETQALWAHAFEASLEVRIGATLTVRLTTTNLDAEPITIGSALHSYFAVGDLNGVSVHGLDDCDYLDTVGTPTVRTQEGPVQFTGEVDRIYRAAPAVELRDGDWDRTLTIENSGSNSTVVWNPFREKAAALTDLPNEGYRAFVCIETANAGQDLVTIDPGEMHTLEARVSVSDAGRGASRDR